MTVAEIGRWICAQEVEAEANRERFKSIEKKLDEYRKIIVQTRDVINETETKHSDFKEKYMEKYMKAREDAGLTEDGENSFMKYLCEDIELDF